MTNKVLDIYNTVAYGNDIDPLSGDLNKEQDRKKIERYLSKKLDSINEDNKAIVKNNTTVTELLAQDIPKLEFKIKTSISFKFEKNTRFVKALFIKFLQYF